MTVHYTKRERARRGRAVRRSAYTQKFLLGYGLYGVDFDAYEEDALREVMGLDTPFPGSSLAVAPPTVGSYAAEVKRG